MMEIVKGLIGHIYFIQSIDTVVSSQDPIQSLELYQLHFLPLKLWIFKVNHQSKENYLLTFAKKCLIEFENSAMLAFRTWWSAPA